MIEPGATIGVLGSGQLGRMFAIAARKMGYRVHTYSPDDDTPTGQVADVEVTAAYDDLDRVRDFASKVKVVTFEFENVPAATTAAAAERTIVRPRGEVLHTTQHRLREKTFLQQSGFPVAPFKTVRSAEDVTAALKVVGCPAVLKTAGWGYDGKGQAKITDLSQAAAAWQNLNTTEGVLEGFVQFEREVSVVKDTDGSCVAALGVERTPEVVVLDRERRLRYRGRIDNQHRLGASRTDVTEDDLVRALQDVLQDREVSLAETTVDGCKITLPAPLKPDTPVTFYEHVSPILQQHCQECHREKGGAPFSLVTLEEVASHAEMIAEVVADRRMPPWHANRKQHFVNERVLTLQQRNQLVAWATSDRAAGDAAKAPSPRSFPDAKWTIGQPDLVTTALLADKLPAEGFVDYVHVVLPYVFSEDTWISAAEIRPSNPATVHHCNMAYVTLGQNYREQNFITGRVPGGTAMILDEGVAFRIPKGSVVALQIHYTTTGKPESNRMSVGFRFPRGVVHQQLHHVQVTTSRFEIPPGASAHPVQATRTLPANASGIGMFAHMHLRGKDMTFRAIYPDGEQETLLSIPNYLYDWQQNYRWQPGTKRFPAGTRIEVTAHFDNSKFNPFNPDPTTPVRHGPQTIHEMMFGFFFYTVDGEDLKLTVDPKTGHAVP